MPRPRFDLLKSRARYVASWHYLWGSLLLASVTLAVLLVIRQDHEIYIRWWGGALQFIGIVMALHELENSRRQFGQDGIRGMVRRKLAAWPTDRAVAANLSVGSVLGSAQAFGLASVQRSAGTSVEERLAALEANAAQFSRDIVRVRVDIESEARDRDAAYKAERQARIEADEKLQREMAQQATGSYAFSIFGLCWLFVGLVLSTTSLELSGWMPKLLQCEWLR